VLYKAVLWFRLVMNFKCRMPCCSPPNASQHDLLIHAVAYCIAAGAGLTHAVLKHAIKDVQCCAQLRAVAVVCLMTCIKQL
jgi:hypothetical protein